MNKKRYFLGMFYISACLLSVSFAAAGGGGEGAGKSSKEAAERLHESETYPGPPSAEDGENYVSLAEAIEQSAEKIAADLPAGSRVAIVAWESENAGLSDYIMEELSGALVDRGMEVADRKNLEHVRRELDFQMSGEVSDETALSIGKFLGAEQVITGQFNNLGGGYRYRANAINVESASRSSATRFSVRNDGGLRLIIKSLSAPYVEKPKSPPGTAGGFLERGVSLASQGEYELAVMDFTEAVKLNPKLSAAYLLRGRAVYAGVSEVIATDENFERVYANFSSGRKLNEKERREYDKAIADFTKAIRLDPNNAVSYLERGDAYRQKNNLDKALADYNRAIRLNPRSANAYTSRSKIYGHQGNYDKAIADLSQAIKLDPDYANAYYSRGNAYYTQGDYDKAIADYSQVIKLDPDYANAYYSRGIAYYTQGDYDKAIADYSQVIKLDPDYANVYLFRGFAYAEQEKNYDKAIADLEAVLRIAPNDSDAKTELEYARKAQFW